MNYKVMGDTDNPIIDITLGKGETIKVESGAMAFMQGVELKGGSSRNL